MIHIMQENNEGHPLITYIKRREDFNAVVKKEDKSRILYALYGTAVFVVLVVTLFR